MNSTVAGTGLVVKISARCFILSTFTTPTASITVKVSVRLQSSLPLKKKKKFKKLKF
jgi:hypothetical protein